ncbi:MAG: preprotein translocase subunit SecG [Deltaproteobacteria bacterium]|nr:MAG: preprotein translocase subunit SecG [Deltaproteobacteria bacterium]
MYTFILIVHIIVSVVLVAVVLMQTGKGAELGAMFGGGASQTIFGPTGPTGLLGKITAIAAVIFMLTSLSLAYMSSHAGKETVMEKAPAQTQQAPPAQMPQPPAQTPAQSPAPAPETPGAPAQQK